MLYNGEKKWTAPEELFEDKKELIEEVKELVEVKSMLRTSIKKLKEEAVKDGLQKGIEQGILMGERQKAIQTAKALLKEKMTVEKISEITGISVKDIKKLKE